MLRVQSVEWQIHRHSVIDGERGIESYVDGRTSRSEDGVTTHALSWISDD